mmetsp:Transcript_7568/g.16404  ORF Transcript_7568/g.16404 Transcript_7568/m.16404 type:complete len:91 (-) Transcript_7568:181-453(-)
MKVVGSGHTIYFFVLKIKWEYYFLFLSVMTANYRSFATKEFAKKNMNKQKAIGTSRRQKNFVLKNQNERRKSSVLRKEGRSSLQKERNER